MDTPGVNQGLRRRGGHRTLHWALALSVLVHAVLLTVRFVDPERFNRTFQDTPLEVILVNARSQQKPDKARAIAQASLAGGGQANQGRATSPLPASPEARTGEALQDEARRIEALRAQQDQLLAQVRQQLATMPLPEPAADRSDTAQVEREQQRQALVKILAEIERRIREENERPLKRYISPATREAVYAAYYDDLRRRIEARGTRQFPEVAGRKLYGELTMMITIHHTGEVQHTEVVHRSDSAVLDRQAQALVRSLSFDRFSKSMRQQADQIVVVSRFRFTRDDTLQTQQATP
jgi:periplasmic protein TonB